MVSLTSKGANSIMDDFGGSAKFNSSNVGRMKHPPSGLKRDISVEIFEFRPFRRDLEGITNGHFTKRLVTTTGKPRYDRISWFKYITHKDERTGKSTIKKIEGSDVFGELELYEGKDPETKEKVYFTYKGKLRLDRINRYGVSLDINIRSIFSRENIHINYAPLSRRKYPSKN